MTYTGFELECRDVNDYSVSNTHTLEVTGVGTWEASFKTLLGSHLKDFQPRLVAHDPINEFGYRADAELDWEGINGLKFQHSGSCYIGLWLLKPQPC
jgi:hypothetical protein